MGCEPGSPSIPRGGPTRPMIAAYNRGVTANPTPEPSWTPGDLPPDLLGSIPLFAELQKVLSWKGGPVNWDLAKQIAVAAAASQESAHTIDAAAEAELAEDARIAEMWIALATPLIPAPTVKPVRALTPAKWAEHACTAYRELIDPIAQKMAASFAQQAPGAMPPEMLPPGMDPSMLAQAIAQMGPMLLGVQTGGVIGGVAKDLLGEHDLPLPADDAGSIAVILPNVDRFAATYGLDPKEVRLWVALHETAHRAIFEGMPGARTQFWATYLDYVASLTVDFSSLLEKLSGLDLSNPAALEAASQGSDGLFSMLGDQAGGTATGRLGHLLALIEAFADRAVEAASEGRLPSAGRIAEAAARNAAEGSGSASMRMFLGISGSDDTRRAADRFTRSVLATSGWDLLSALWDDPAKLPSSEELADPDSWTRRISS